MARKVKKKALLAPPIFRATESVKFTETFVTSKQVTKVFWGNYSTEEVTEWLKK